MKTKLTLIPAIAAAALLFSTANSEARGQNNVVRMAHNIEKIAKDLKGEFQTHYKRTRSYRHLMTDINQLIAKADHIDGLAHNPYTSYKHIKTDLAELDKLSHHLHQVVDRNDSGCTGSLNHVHAKLNSLNNAIHQMERGIAVYSRPAPSKGCRGNNSGNGNYNSNRRIAASRETDWSSYARSFFSSFFNSGVQTTNSHAGHNH